MTTTQATGKVRYFMHWPYGVPIPKDWRPVPAVSDHHSFYSYLIVREGEGES